MKKTSLSILFFIVFFISNAQTTILKWSQVEIVRLGKNITYLKKHNYDIKNPDKPLNPLNGFYKITDNYGSYSEITFKNGKVNGTWKDFDFEGKLKALSVFKEGQFVGKNTEYYQNGNVSKEVFYENGKAIGTWKEYDKNGKVTSLEHYKNGLKEGKWTKQIRHNGDQICTETHFYKNDKPSGIWKEICNDKITWSKEYLGEKKYTEKVFFSNGKIKTLKEYKNGKLNGNYKEYKQDEVLIKHFRFKEGKAILKKTFYSNGNQKSISNYKNSNIHGSYKKYHENGKLELEAFYNESYKTGIWKEYSYKGKLTSIQEYKNGVENGPFKHYSRTGILKKEGAYLRGKAEGLWKIYNRDGSLYKDVTYENGRIISEKKYN